MGVSTVLEDQTSKPTRPFLSLPKAWQEIEWRSRQTEVSKTPRPGTKGTPEPEMPNK